MWDRRYLVFWHDKSGKSLGTRERPQVQRSDSGRGGGSGSKTLPTKT